MDEIDVPLWKKEPHGPKPPQSGICPACNKTVIRRHCKNRSCVWFRCVHHSKVSIVFGKGGHFADAKALDD